MIREACALLSYHELHESSLYQQLLTSVTIRAACIPCHLQAKVCKLASCLYCQHSPLNMSVNVCLGGKKELFWNALWFAAKGTCRHSLTKLLHSPPKSASPYPFQYTTQNYITHTPEGTRTFYIPSCSFMRVPKIMKATISFILSLCLAVCLSVRMEKLGSQWTNFGEIIYLSIYQNSLQKIQV